MTPAGEQRIRAAVAELGEALVAALDDAPAASPDALLDAAEACERLGGIARSTLYALGVPSLKVGRRRFWPAQSIAGYIDALAPPEAR